MTGPRYPGPAGGRETTIIKRGGRFAGFGQQVESLDPVLKRLSTISEM
ncbi:hypothetical protein SAMN05216332_105125 [Nitrosospira briensis]|nr:hypothetical protein SAMN05216332_105125 [Nitrosospira briensis]